MRDLFFLIPFCLIGTTPYQQTKEKVEVVSVDSLTTFEKDTLTLYLIEEDIHANSNLSQELKERKKILKRKLQRLIEKEKLQKEKEKQLLKQIEKDAEEFNNRGL